MNDRDKTGGEFKNYQKGDEVQDWWTAWECPIRTHTLVDFMHCIEKYRGVRMIALAKSRHKKCHGIEAYILNFNVPQQRCRYIDNVMNQIVIRGTVATKTSKNF